MPEALEYESEDGRSPFSEWYWRLEARAAARVRRTIIKLEAGLRPDVKGVGEGVFESRINFGPGYRVYFGVDGTTLIVILGGGDKSSQDGDIAEAKRRWADYKARKRRTQHHGAHP
ncbi:MAG: type II toxin-antitoxin system RelE/ParE family toxin [Acetobacteraceae bacterium]